jgi:hypothetical protein
MFRKTLFNILGLLVGLTIIGGSWSIAIGLVWGMVKIVEFIFATIPYSSSVVKYMIVMIALIPIVLVSQVLGLHVISKYIRVKE